MAACAHARQPSAVQVPEQVGQRNGSGKAKFGRAAGHAKLCIEASWPQEGEAVMARVRYMVVIERGDTSWGAHVPDLPGCVAVGESRDEVRRLIREAIELHIEGLKQDGLPVPAPSSEGEFVDVGAA